MVEVTDESFEQAVLRADRPVVVDFWAPWCRPCRAVEPILEALAATNRGRIVFARLNIDEHAGVASRYDVLSMPTETLFEGGEARAAVAGARSREHYERVWSAWLG